MVGTINHSILHQLCSLNVCMYVVVCGAFRDLGECQLCVVSMGEAKKRG